MISKKKNTFIDLNKNMKNLSLFLKGIWADFFNISGVDFGCVIKQKLLNFVKNFVSKVKKNRFR
jgi:hypothetical protein